VICPVLKVDFHVTRGRIAWFESSELACRGFCRDCGTPLILDYTDYPDLGVMSGTFDNPDDVPPVIQYGNESRVSWIGMLTSLPGTTATYSVDPNGFLPRIKASNRQHPDHDTDVWPPTSSDAQ